MHTDDSRISLADLSSAGIRLRPSEAATLVREVIRQVSHGEVPGVPSAHVIRLTPAGSLTVEGPVAADDRAVARAAQLLDSILPSFEASGVYKVPGALRLVVARALGTLDVPPYENLATFDEALHRFSLPDPGAVIRQVLDAAGSWRPAGVQHALPAADASGASSPVSVEHEWHVPRETTDSLAAQASSALARRETAALTISDIRRARRATGLSLAEIAERSRVPVPLLRQLEWGYFDNWPAGLYGRTQLVRYARAAGLDEQVVLAAVWPSLEARTQESEIVEAAEVTTVPLSQPLEPVSAGDVVLDVNAAAGEELPRKRRAGAGAALLAAAALLALVALPGLQDRLAVRFAPTSTSNARPAPTALEQQGDVARAATDETEVPVATEAEGTGGSALPAAPREEGVERREVAAPVDSPAPADAAMPVRGLSGAETAWSPAFASVGSAMFYHAQAGREGESDVVRAETDAEGTVLRITRVVDDNARNFHARPSPDGSRIAFDSDRDGVRGVYVADADGSNVRRVSGDGFAAVPSWSPDGQSLAFVRAEASRPTVWNLWLLHLPTGESRRLTSYRYGQPWGGSWFPDGRRIAYSHEDRLVVLDLETGRDQVFPSPRKGRLVRTPAVSPDGSRIIFQVHRDGAWLLDLSDGSVRKVLADPTAEEYAWSPDGRRVAYHSRRSGQWGVWLMAGR